MNLRIHLNKAIKKTIYQRWFSYSKGMCPKISVDNTLYSPIGGVEGI